MRAFGYDKNDLEAETPKALREVTLALTREELDSVIAFLQEVRCKWGQERPQSHWHFRDWATGWKPSEPDFIIACDG
jgi:hypothetical protein